ncbi:MAG TPA: dihydrofolate reductase family protein [Mycobacteriales bacterium]|nr:dihydrofolate reductase family protein [Mycobacteriales bacterium]
MGNLIYAAITSLDGYVNDASGEFGWAAPDEEVHAAANALEREVGTCLYGRRMYEVMRVWESMDLTEEPAVMREYADLWRASDKVVYSTTLASVGERTRLERSWDPEVVRQLKDTSDRPLSIGGPGLAQHAFADGLVDEVHLFLTPVVVGGGTRALPDGVRLDLDLRDEGRFAGGVVHLHYEVRR